MIQLFNIPNYTIDTSKFSNMLHDKIVDQFTEEFCAYVGAKYGCATNSASSIIYLLADFKSLHFSVPTMIPPVVLNAIKNGRATQTFTDDTEWIGSSYLLYNKGLRIIDSAQEVKPIQLYGGDMAIYSFYPTKPVGSCDGGMIVSNNKDTIDFFKSIVYDGRTKGASWENPPDRIGWKMYMNSIQAYIARQNLRRLDEKKDKLSRIRHIYNHAFGLNNTSDHLYTIQVANNSSFVQRMLKDDIVCGIHYKCTHKMVPYFYSDTQAPQSEELENHIVSIPFHEALSEQQIDVVIKKVKQYVETV